MRPSAELFANAISFDGSKRKELLREYADQLSFNGRAESAIPLYKEVLDDVALTDLDRKRAMKGLADAYSWANNSDGAVAAYTALVKRYPNDTNLLSAKLVASARQAAHSNRNKEAAELFAQAIKIDATPSTSTLAEYADQLSFSGRSIDAIGVYRQVLGQPDLTTAERLSTQKGLARSYDWSGNQTEAISIYTGLIVEHPNDDALKQGLIVIRAHESGEGRP